MKRFIFAGVFLALLGVGGISPQKAAEINCDSAAWKDKDFCKKDEDSGRVKTDVNIRGNETKYLFNELIPAEQKPNSQIFYDREYKGSQCNVFGYNCLVQTGVIAKWSNFFVEIQPYEHLIPARALARGKKIFPIPSQTIWFKISGESIEVPMTNRDKLQYYLPLKVRKAIAKNDGELSIEIPGIRFPIYVVGEKARNTLDGLVNTNRELQEYLGQSSGNVSKAERLKELQDLLDQGLINQDEYTDGRKKIIND